MKIKIIIGIKFLILHVLIGTLRWLPLGRRKTFDRVVFKVDRIGDFILSLGCLHAMLDRPDQQAAIIVNDAVFPLAEVEFPGVTIISVKFVSGSFFSELLPALLKIRLYNLYARQLICLRYQRIDYHDALLKLIRCSWSCGCTVMLEAHPRHALSHAFHYTPNCEYGREKRWCRELDRHKAMSLAVCGSADVLPRSLNIGLRQTSVIPEVIIAPFGSNPIRDIPAYILEQLIKLILDNSSAAIMILAAPDQRDRLDGLAHMRGERVECCCGFALLDYASMISAAELIISADSATAHLATLFDGFLLCFFGGGHFGEFVPWSKSDKQVWIIRHLDCFHCDWHCIYDAPRCIYDIDVNLARQATVEILERSGLRNSNA